jgi:thiol:disulfide interchange protein DsbD
MTPALLAAPSEDGSPRPDGAIYAWINSFLLPEPRPENWTGNLEAAIKESVEYRQKTGKPKLIFVDFTGKTCTNCKINENSVFTKSEIRKLFQSYTLVQLYTDAVPLEFYGPEDQAQAKKANRPANDADINTSFQRKAFDNEQLPLYVILEPQADGKTVWYYGPYGEGKINDVEGFAEFLRSPLKQTGTLAQAGR